MIKALFLCALLICTASAFAAPVDPAPDHIGVYFDPGATVTNFTSTPNVPFTVYVVITNPTLADIWGAELSYHLVAAPGFESAFSRTGNSGLPYAVDLGTSDDPAQGDYIMARSAPLAPATAVVVVTWELVLTDDFALDIYLGPAGSQSLDQGLPAYAAGDSLLSLGLQSGDVGLPVATVNGGVSDVPGRVAQRSVVLEQCQPNPFNPRTTIRYSVAREGPVKLSVHDVSGRTVRVLLDGTVVRPGEHEVVWDGLDNAGGDVASGVYFYRLEALGLSETRSMTLVR